jgi:hypothetical protein
VVSSGVKTGCVKLESQVWGDRNKVVDGVQATPSSSKDRGDLSIVLYMIRCKADCMVRGWRRVEKWSWVVQDIIVGSTMSPSLTHDLFHTAVIWSATTQLTSSCLDYWSDESCVVWSSLSYKPLNTAVQSRAKVVDVNLTVGE